MNGQGAAALLQAAPQPGVAVGEDLGGQQPGVRGAAGGGAAGGRGVTKSCHDRTGIVSGGSDLSPKGGDGGSEELPSVVLILP